MNKIIKNYLYIEDRDENGVLKKIFEVKRTNDYSLITDLNKELTANLLKESQEKEENKYIQMQEKQKRMEDEEMNDYLQKYSLEKFLLAIQWCMFFGKIDTLEPIKKILLVDNKYDRSKLIESSLNKVEFLNVKEIFEKL